MEPDVKALDSLLQCPICLEEIITNEIFSQLDSCNHNMCEPCFKQLIYYSDNCPLCGLQFSGCLYIKDNNIIHQHILTEIELQSVKKNKNFHYHEENFECITREELLKDLNHYQKLAENIKINLFVRRNCDGSNKEYAILEEILDQLHFSHKAVSCRKFDSKSVIKDLESVINSIKELQQRKYKNEDFYDYEDEVLYYENEYECNYDDFLEHPNNCHKQNILGTRFSIEYVDAKKSGSKKRKR